MEAIEAEVETDNVGEAPNQQSLDGFDGVVVGEAPKQQSLDGFDDVVVVFDGQGNKHVHACIDGVGYEYPVDEPVTVKLHVAEVIGHFTVI